MVGSGPSLAFIAFPEAIAKMDHMGAAVPPLMSFLFFFMILTLGLDSMFTMIETLTTAILDQFRALRAVKGNSIFRTSKKNCNSSPKAEIYLKRSEGDRRPTERSVFKFFFQKLAVL